MKFYIRPNMNFKIKALGSFTSSICFSWMYYSRNDGNFQGSRFYLGSQGNEERYYVVALFLVIALFTVYFSLTRNVVLTEDELKIKISVAGDTIKFKNISDVQEKDKNIFIMYNEDSVLKEVCLQPRDYERFIQELIKRIPI